MEGWKFSRLLFLQWGASRWMSKSKMSLKPSRLAKLCVCACVRACMCVSASVYVREYVVWVRV